MTTTPRPAPAVTRHRLAVVVGLAVFLVLTGTGVATALWTTAATTTAPATAGRLTVGLAGTAGLTTQNITTTKHTSPVELTLHNTSSVPVTYNLKLGRNTGTLTATEIQLVLWEREGTACPTTIPATGTTTGTLADPPPVPAAIRTGQPGSTTALCAATRFTGTLFGSADRSLTATLGLIGRLTDTNWRATAEDGALTQTIAPAPDTVTNLQCNNQDALLGLLGSGIRLTWTPAAGATKYTVRTSAGRTLEVTDPTVDLAINNAGEATWVDVVAIGPTGESTAVRKPVRVSSVLLLGRTLRCA